MFRLFHSIFMISMIFLLSSCATNRADPTLSAHATSYKQNGKHYKILRSAKNYEEKGLASWYGRKFNKKRTSSGERFNMYQMTAAHKTLPLSTRVKVTNLANGKYVIVRINDRGPFVSNRLIDLSYAAAKKLGILNRGMGRVSVKSV